MKVVVKDGKVLIDDQGRPKLTDGETPSPECCCEGEGGGGCPTNGEFSSVEIFGNAATAYTDAGVPNFANGANFIATFGASFNNKVWYYNNGTGIEWWFFVRAPNEVTCFNQPYFDTYGYNANVGAHINNETWCCENVWNGVSYFADGIDTDWEAMP